MRAPLDCKETLVAVSSSQLVAFQAGSSRRFRRSRCGNPKSAQLLNTEKENTHRYQAREPAKNFLARTLTVSGSSSVDAVPVRF